MIFVFIKDTPKNNIFNIGVWDTERQVVHQENFNKDRFKLEYIENENSFNLLNKLDSIKLCKNLSSVCNSTSGYGGKSKLITNEQVSYTQIKTLKGFSIQRYEINKYFWFEFKKENITGRTTDKLKLGAKHKLLIRKTGDSIIATFEDEGIFPEQSLYFLYNMTIDPFYFLGLLNSKILNFYYRERCLTNKKSIAQVKKIDLDQLPIKIIDEENVNDVRKQKNLISYVKNILNLHKKLTDTRDPRTREVLQRQIAATDAQIDKQVYALYGLTDEEIAIVEAGL